MTSAGRDDVALRLRHLLPLAVEDEPEADDGLVGRAIEEQHADGQQRVEPAARLVERLADEVRVAARLEALQVLERRVVLREGHRARVEPDVDDLGHALHARAAVRAREADLVDEGPVRVLQAHARELLELVERPDDVGVLGVARAAPHRQRRAPVALARQRPVDVAAQPVAHAPLADVLGVPVDLAVGLDELVAQRRGRDVPRALGVVDERIARAPAVRVGVLDRLGPQQPPAGAQVLDEVGSASLTLRPTYGPMRSS